MYIYVHTSDTIHVLQTSTALEHASMYNMPQITYDKPMNTRLQRLQTSEDLDQTALSYTISQLIYDTSMNMRLQRLQTSEDLDKSAALLLTRHDHVTACNEGN